MSPSLEPDLDVRAVIDAVRADVRAADQRVHDESNHTLRQSAYDARPSILQIGDHTEIARHLRQVLAKDLLIHDLGETYRYREGLGTWTQIPHRCLEAMVADLSGTLVNTGKNGRPLQVSRATAREAAAQFGMLVEQSKRNQSFANAPYGLGFENGFLTIEDGVAVLRPHSPAHLCRYAYDFAYAPRAPHPMLDRFFEIVFRGETPEDRARLVQLLQEFVGACLFGRAWCYEKVLVLLGPGGNGKSQWLEIARSIFPEGSIAALPPQKWGEPYSIEQLAGKLANFVDEIPEREITSHATFKAVVSGQPTTAQRKYRDNVEFRPICGQMWSANALFSTTDTSEGFFRRFLVVPFNWKPLEHEAVPDIGRTIGQQERRALVSWAIEGYVRLLANRGRFTMPDVVAKRTAAWTTEADRVRMFFFALYEEHPTADYFPIGELYKRYEQWCDQCRFLPVSKPKFATAARSTRMVVDMLRERTRGFVWDRGECERLFSTLGAHRPEWGEVPEMPNRTYGGFSYGNTFR